MSGHVRDRWMRRDLDTGRKVRTGRYGKGMRWQAVAVRPDGTRVSRQHATEAEAKLWLAKTQTDPLALAPRAAFSTVADAWLDNHHRLRDSSRTTTRQKLERMIKPALTGVDVGDVTRTLLQEMVSGWVRAGYAPATIRTAWSYVASILREARLDGLLAGDPAEGVKLPPKQRPRVVPLTDDQVIKLMGAVPRSLRAMVLLGATSGLRPAELAGLTWDRVEGTAVRVDRQLVAVASSQPAVWGRPKSEAGYRVVGVGQDVLDELVVHREEFPPGVDGLLFRGPRGSLMTRQRRSETWRRYRDAIGGREGEGWHQLRHYHASKLINAGMSVVAVAARLGHQDPTETLQTYAHLWPGDEASMESVAVASGVVLLGRSVDAAKLAGRSLDAVSGPRRAPLGIIGNRRVTRID